MVASYVSDFIPKFASVVAVETFEQRFRVVGVGGAVNPVSGMTSQWRLKSDVLLVQDPTTAGDLMWFRDVSEVDGKIVRHEPDRLMKLFATPSVSGAWRLRRGHESAPRPRPDAAAVLPPPSDRRWR
jgi:hypothetical protein